MKRAGLLPLILLAASSVAGAATKPSLEQRVQRMEDESAIRKMLIEYGAFLDGRDYAAYAGLFASNGVWVGGFGSFTGPEAIARMLEANLGKAESGFINKSNFHMLTNPIIEIDGDHAHVTSKYLFWTKSADDKPVPMLAGRYVDEFVRENGQWRIAKRTTYGAIPYRDPAHPEQNAPAPALGSAPPTDKARIEWLEAQIAVARILMDYAGFLDSRDYSHYTALFAPDGEWIGGGGSHKGQAAIRAMLAGTLGPEGALNRENFHIISNPQVDISDDGKSATAVSRYVFVMRGPDGRPVPSLAGIYRDELVKAGDHWVIQRRVADDIMPTPEQWRTIIAGQNAEKAKAAKK
jgi:3-phenylpropionate/cinnamic acid dioxygenase small subunit